MGQSPAKTKKRKGKFFLNPEFDRRILDIGALDGTSGKLVRGRIIKEDGSQVIRFLYNPISVDVTHRSFAVGDDSVRDDALSQTTTGQLIGLGDIGLSLLYDRTYEMWDSSLKKTEAGRLGVYADVLAFYRFLGIVEEFRAVRLANGTSEAKAWENSYPTAGLNTENRAYVYIGNRLKYYGNIDACQVTYTHFNRKMIPTRAVVNINLQLQEDQQGEVNYNNNGGGRKGGRGRGGGKGGRGGSNGGRGGRPNQDGTGYGAQDDP